MSVNPNLLGSPPKVRVLSELWRIFLDQDEKGRQEIKWSFALMFGITVGVILVGVFSYFSRTAPSRGHVLAVSLLSSGSSLAVGLLVGFLFGIPRVVQQHGGLSSPPDMKLSANTNLEQISDWLTKIIVGVGLVQLGTLPGKLKALAGYFATAFGTPEGAVPGAAVLTILGYFGIFGFLLGYLWARIYLIKVLST
ncbi:MAG TPA: hypothetical protein VE961_11180 [Pyrinomonadaceae bacterium]|nr:hypothetical protein [Pyrinomonadaceae bacterium]